MGRTSIVILIFLALFGLSQLVLFLFGRPMVVFTLIIIWLVILLLPILVLEDGIVDRSEWGRI